LPLAYVHDPIEFDDGIARKYYRIERPNVYVNPETGAVEAFLLCCVPREKTQSAPTEGASVLIWPVREWKPAVSARVEGTFTIPADHAPIAGMTLTAILFEYDPFLADASADKLDEVNIEDVSHVKGKSTTIRFTAGAGKAVRGDRRYYLTCRGYRAGEYVYHGQPSHGGIGKVLGKDNPNRVTFVGEQMKP
jgi:hypothetical protein